MRDTILGILLLVAVFALSVFVRKSELLRPLTSTEDIAAIQTVIPMQVWADSAENATQTKYNPLLSFPNRGDAFIAVKEVESVQDKKGNSYWVKYPQLGFMLPYFIMKTLQFPAKHFAFYLMQINIIIQFLCGLFLFLTILTVISAIYPHTKYAGASAFMGTTLYFFLPQSLEYQSVAYFPEMLSQLWLIMLFWVIARMTLLKKGNILYIIMLAIFSIAYIYTDWFALFTVLGVCIYCITHLSQSPSGRVWYISMFATLSGLLLSVWQYSSVLTMKKFIAGIQNVFYTETGLKAYSSAELWGNTEKWQQLFTHYGLGFPLLIGVLLISVLLLLANGKLKETLRGYDKTIALLFWVLFVPSLLYQLIFFHSAVTYPYSVLKISYVFAIIPAIFAHPLISNQEGKAFGKWLNPIALTLVLTICVSFSLFAYQKSTERITTDPYLNLGIFIKQKAQPNESLFVKASHWDNVAPILTHYANRNLQLYKDTTEIKTVLNNNNADRAVIFVWDSMQNYKLPIRYFYRKK